MAKYWGLGPDGRLKPAASAKDLGVPALMLGENGTLKLEGAYDDLVLTVDTSLSMSFNFRNLTQLNTSEDLLINWGDGLSSSYKDLPATASETYGHTYSTAGKFVIQLSATQADFTCGNNIALISVAGAAPIRTSNTWTQYFADCRNLETIQRDFFSLNAKPSKTTGVQQLFARCYALKEIPEGFFDYLSDQLLLMNGLCINCTGLVGIPAELFKTNTSVTTFQNTFSGCSGVTSEVPELWTRTNVKTYSGCFSRCTNAANYSDIPSSWGGPA